MVTARGIWHSSPRRATEATTLTTLHSPAQLAPHGRAGCARREESWECVAITEAGVGDVQLHSLSTRLRISLGNGSLHGMKCNARMKAERHSVSDARINTITEINDRQQQHGKDTERKPRCQNWLCAVSHARVEPQRGLVGGPGLLGYH